MSDPIKIFESRLPKQEFVSITDIVRAGLCKSPNTVWKMLRKGVLPCLRISRNKTMIPRASLIDHIRKSYNLSKEG